MVYKPEKPYYNGSIMWYYVHLSFREVAVIRRIIHWIYALSFRKAFLLIFLGSAAFLVLRKRFRSNPRWKWGLAAGLLLWLGAVMYLTVLLRMPGSSQATVFLPLFASYREVLQGGQKELLRSNFMNALMFYPAGLLCCGILPDKWKGAVKIPCIGVAAFALSAGIEWIQYSQCLGLAEWDDVFHNTLGAALAAGICCLKLPQQERKPMITENQNLLLTLLSHALRGSRPDPAALPENTDWAALFKTAAQHKLMPLIIATLPADRIPEVAAMKRVALQQMVSQTVRTNAFLELYGKMEETGFHPMVVKGILCRALYPQGDLRPSGDEDLYVPDSEFDGCCAFLREYGLAPTTEASPEAFEIGWRNHTLYIELHRRLFSPESGAYGDLNGFFENAAGNRYAYPAEYGMTVHSLPPQEHMLYLLLHAYKHFLHSGFGIRQVCDIGLWARKYHDQIQWDTLAEKCRSCNAFGFSLAVLGIAGHYLEIPMELPEIWHSEKDYCEPLLRDILSGGIYGSADSSRQHSATVTLNAVEADRTGSRRSILASLFPSRASMEYKYPYLRKYPLLLPIAWLHRILCYLRKNRSNNTDPTASAAIGQERVDLLKFYGIIK